MSTNGGELPIRRLTGDDWAAFRDVRLHALASEPGWFFRSHAEEQSKTESEWREWLDGTSSAIFGVFDGTALVGITGVVTSREDPSGETALFVATYLLPHYRRRGVARGYFEARLAWVRSRGSFKRAVVSHRASNVPSGRAIRRAGFTFVETIHRTWPDGAEDDEVTYEMPIS